MCGSTPVRHYLLTRFNLPLWNKDKRGLATRDEVWLEDRFRLFEQYTLPCVLQQSCKDFTWVVLFDGDTPPVYRERVKRWAERCENFKYVPVKSEYARFYPQVFARWIENDLQGCVQPTKVITSWLDNDDVLGCNYMATVRNDAQRLCGGTFFFYKRGLQYFLKQNYALWISFPNNHFVSRVEDFTLGSHLKTVYEFGTHYYLSRMENVRSVMLDTKDDEPLWGEVVHERNVDNDVKMSLDFRFVRDSELLSCFALNRTLNVGRLYCWSRFLPHAIKVFLKHVQWKLTGHKMGL